MRIIDLINFIDGRFELVDKKLGVELVETGFLNYAKLTPENYNYWWYEVKNINKINNKNFTYNWNDLTKTRKFKILEELIGFHKDNESLYTLLNNALNIISAQGDGINLNTGIPCFIEVFNMYYKNKKKQVKQLKIEFV